MRVFKITFVLVSFFGFFSVWSKSSFERPMTIIITSYNNKDWYKKNLDALFNQSYSNYKVVYVDDCSTDKTGDLVEQYIKENGWEDRIMLIKNEKRMFKMYNFYHAVHEYCDDDDIVFDYDGDDWFAHKNVLRVINKAYSDPDVWLTYGSYKDFPSGKKGISRKLPRHIVSQNAYRKYGWVTSHLRTFYAWLFKLIKIEDVLCEGAFIRAAVDMAGMFPMLEIAGPRHKFIREILYVYNVKTPFSVNKVMRDIQARMDRYIRSRPCYKKLKCRP